jgi:hypothetical protein
MTETKFVEGRTGNLINAASTLYGGQQSIGQTVGQTVSYVQQQPGTYTTGNVSYSNQPVTYTTNVQQPATYTTGNR